MYRVFSKNKIKTKRNLNCIRHFYDKDKTNTIKG